MPNDWLRKTVAELQAAGLLLVEDGNHGEYRPRTSEFGSGNWAFIRAADMDGGTVHFESAERINDVAFARIRKGIGKGGDVLFSHKGTVGKLAIAPINAPQFVCSPQTTFWRTLNEAKLSRRFLYYYMQSRAFTEQWVGRKGETDMADYVSLTAQRELFVSIPPLQVQKEIATVLGSLDDKIEQNRRTGRKLEELARAVFKAWFVDFEPVKAKAAGATAFPGMPTETFAALPTRFVDSELGPVPEGWEVRPLEDCVSHLIDHRGKTPKKLGGDWALQGTPALSAKNVKSGRILRAELNNFVDDEMFRRWMPVPLTLNDIVMTSEAPLGELVYLARSADYCLSQRVFGIRSNRDVMEPSYLYRFLESANAQAQLAGRASGTTVVGIRQSELRKILIPVAPISIQKAASRMLQACEDLTAQMDESSAKLAALRDYLLPRLLSGRVRVAEHREVS